MSERKPNSDEQSVPFETRSPEERFILKMEAIFDDIRSSAVEEFKQQQIEDGDAELRLLSVEEVSQLAGVGRTLIYEQIRRGRLRSLKVGRRRLIRVSDYRDWVESMVT